jgi:hypothetical protein
MTQEQWQKNLGQKHKTSLETSRWTRHSLRARADIFCAQLRTSDVGARETPRSVVTAGPLCKEGKFAKEIARLANLDST